MSTISRKAITVALAGAVVLAGWGLLHARSAWVRAVASGAGDLPELRVERREWDFGTIEAGQGVQASFEIMNAGTKRLILNPQVDDCRCLAGADGQLIVPPGKTARLELQVPTTGPHGAIVHRFHFATNDPRVPALTFRVSGSIGPKESQP